MPAIRRLIRHELSLLRLLARDRRVASSRMPELMRTGLARKFADDGQQAGGSTDCSATPLALQGETP